MKITSDDLSVVVQQLAHDIAIIKARLTRSEENSPVQKVLGISEAATFLGLKKATLYSMVSRGEIPYSKPSKHLLFLQEDLIAWLRSCRRKSASELRDEAEQEFLKSNKRR